MMPFARTLLLSCCASVVLAASAYAAEATPAATSAATPAAAPALAATATAAEPMQPGSGMGMGMMMHGKPGANCAKRGAQADTAPEPLMGKREACVRGGGQCACEKHRALEKRVDDLEKRLDMMQMMMKMMAR